MRRLLATILATTLGLAVLLPSAAAAQDPPDCAQKIREFQHYRGMLERAEASGNQVWIEGLETHVELLYDRLDVRCPEYTAQSKALRQAVKNFQELVKEAGQAALTFFTMGAM